MVSEKNSFTSSSFFKMIVKKNQDSLRMNVFFPHYLCSSDNKDQSSKERHDTLQVTLIIHKI